MEIPKIFIKDRKKYIYVKSYDNYYQYKEAKVGYLECFCKHDLNLIEPSARTTHLKYYNHKK